MSTQEADLRLNIVKVAHADLQPYMWIFLPYSKQHCNVAQVSVLLLIKA